MKVIIFLSILIILHIVVILGLIFSDWLETLRPSLSKIFLIAFGILILSDIIFGLYFLISKPPKKEGSGYHKLKIEETDKQEVKK